MGEFGNFLRIRAEFMDYKDQINHVIFDLYGPIHETGHCRMQSPGEVKPSHHLDDDLYSCDIDRDLLCLDLEYAFNRVIPDNVAEAWGTVGDIYRHFESVSGGSHVGCDKND